MCTHTPRCPLPDAPDHDAARVIADHSEQGWYLLCGGTIVFSDLGEITAAGKAVAPPAKCLPRPRVESQPLPPESLHANDLLHVAQP